MSSDVVDDVDDVDDVATLSMIFSRFAMFNRGRSQVRSSREEEKGGEARRGILRIQGERKEERAMGKPSRASQSRSRLRTTGPGLTPSHNCGVLS